jgi:putative proteasome-type protease
LTYCIAINVNDGLVLASDSRTNAGVDQVNVYSKMHRLLGDGERTIVVMTAGNLATSQAVIRRLRHDLDEGADRNLKTIPKLAGAAEYIGEISVAEQEKRRKRQDKNFNPEASFILAGQIKGSAPFIYLIYAEGNYIRSASRAPFLQIGELKYGKPILDRIIAPELDLETAARCALVSMDSTQRSNLSVGPPIELLIYHRDSFGQGLRYVLDEDDAYLRKLRDAWQAKLQEAFATLPHLPAQPTPMRLVDAPGDQ